MYASVCDQGSDAVIVCFTSIEYNIGNAVLCGCWLVNQCVIEHTLCLSSNFWHQLPVGFKMKLWALRSAWTLIRSFYSSELSALHYYLISRSTQAGITTHPEPIEELYKAFFLSETCFGAYFSLSNPTKKSFCFHGLWKNMRLNTVVAKKSVIRLLLCSCLLFKMTWK